MNTLRKKSELCYRLLQFVMLQALIILAISNCNGGQSPSLVASSSPPVSSSGGSQTWIEFPPDGSNLPMAAVPLVVYASGAQGVSQVDFWINGQQLPAGRVIPLSAGGANRLVRVEQSYQPPAEGTYIFQAAGRGGSGGHSQASPVTFCVGACQGAASPGAPTSTPTPATTTPTLETLTPLATTPVGTPLQMEFWASQPYVNGGECTQLNWAVTGAQSVQLEGNPVAHSSSQQVCPCIKTTYKLRVTKLDSTIEDRLATVDVYGSCEVISTTEPPPPQDTSGPDISGGYLVWEGCQVFGQASISDESGLSWAKFGYNLNSGGWNWVWMSQVGGDTWQSEAGITIDTMGTPAGTIQYRFQASDNSGNDSTSAVNTFDYMGCGG